MEASKTSARPHYSVLIREVANRVAGTTGFGELGTDKLVEMVLDLERAGWAPEVSPELQKAREKYAELYPDRRDEALGGALDDRDTLRLLVRLFSDSK